MTKATPGISGCSPCCDTRGGYSSYAQDMGSNGFQRVCEDDGDDRRPLTKKDLISSPAFVAMASTIAGLNTDRPSHPCAAAKCGSYPWIELTSHEQSSRSAQMIGIPPYRIR